MLKILNTRVTLADVSILLLRLWLGSMMIFHGYKKVFGNMERFVGGVADLGFPFPEFFAYAAAFSEFLGGIFIILGLFFRPVLLFVIITMLVAVFGAHADDPFGRKELPLTFAFISAATLLTGPGKFSLDALIVRLFKR